MDDFHQASGRDLNLVVGQKHNATVGGDIEERIQGLRKSVADVSQRLISPRTWLGSEGVSVQQVLCDLIDVVQDMNVQIAVHVHAASPPPNNAGDFSTGAMKASLLSGKLRPITL